ncbi:MAG TPA: pilus assembly protein [Ideonella sp.]|uniref:Flp family type IVb pilin n=1 Tax=Ideonella sp. TaxID=1929293 RepID=UPI002C652437|nr:pilus assembly protein [Ideonella sp.]HSI48221.1 pilus assembly protein [Ideonella sp.]
MNRISSKLARSRGQGMTEYIIIVALIAVAAIGVYNYFGRTVRNQTGAMAAGLAGQQTEADAATKQATSAGKAAKNDAATQRGLSKFADNVGEH